MKNEAVLSPEQPRENFIGTREIWKTDVLGVGPYVIERDGQETEILCTVRRMEDAQVIANSASMRFALEETLNFLRDDPAQLKLSKDDLLDLIDASLAWQEIKDRHPHASPGDRE